MIDNQVMICSKPTQGAPTVSVVMAVHRDVQLKYLEEAVFSVLGQEYSDYEFLIVADGPLDKRQETFLFSQMESDNRIVICRTTKNRGPGAARNLGILQAKGRYVAIMDSDDISMPGRLSAEVDYLDAHIDVAVVGSSCDVIDEEGEITGHRHLPENPEALRKYAPFFCPLNNPTIMARAAILREYLYDEKWRYGEDYRLWLRLLAANYKLANIRESFLKFRVDSHLYKRRVGYEKAKSDLMHRIYAVRIVSIYIVPFVIIFAIIAFSVRFMPHKIVENLTTARDYFREKSVKQ